jgi:hypothetical protein
MNIMEDEERVRRASASVGASDTFFLNYGLFHAAFSALDLAIDVAIGRFLKLSHAEAHLVTAICCENISVRRICSAAVAPMVIGLLVMVCAATPPGASIRGCAATPIGKSATNATNIRLRWRRLIIIISEPLERAAAGW